MAMIRPETEMKDSGVQWIGDIPNNWNIKPLYACLDEINQKNNPIVTTNILSLTITDGVIPYSERGNQGNKSKENFEEYKVVYPNTIVANSMNILIGSVGLSQYEGCVSPVYYVYAAKPQVDIRYMNYLFQMEPFQKRLRQFANGILEIRLRVSSHDILHQKVAVPAYDEQQAIADYLDETCSKIDEIIAEAKASIDEYKELKQSVIFEAVTKGLDKNVEMKDSGIEWIGEIPKNWTLYRLKHLLQSPMQYGANATGLEYDKTMPRYVRITDIDSNGNLKDVGKQSLSWDVAEPYLLEDGDLLLARSGGTVGKAFLYKKSYGTCAFAGYLIRAKANDKVLPEYIHYYTLSKGYEIWKNGIFIKATIQNIGADKYANLPIPIPTDIEIQREVVKYLDSKCNTLDSLIAEKESLINDLEAYKKSLIYEVVTGKRRVV